MHIAVITRMVIWMKIETLKWFWLHTHTATSNNRPKGIPGGLCFKNLENSKRVLLIFEIEWVSSKCRLKLNIWVVSVDMGACFWKDVVIQGHDEDEEIWFFVKSNDGRQFGGDRSYWAVTRLILVWLPLRNHFSVFYLFMLPGKFYGPSRWMT